MIFKVVILTSIEDSIPEEGDVSLTYNNEILKVQGTSIEKVAEKIRKGLREQYDQVDVSEGSPISLIDTPGCRTIKAKVGGSGVQERFLTIIVVPIPELKISEIEDMLRKALKTYT